MAEVKPIRTEADYDAAVARIGELMDAPIGTPEGDELDVLGDLVLLYEQGHMEREFPDPLSAIEFRMDQAGLTPRDLVPILGSRSKVSEVLAGKRGLTIAMARALHKHLGIHADVLLQEPGATLDPDLGSVDLRRFPLKEMAKRAWIPNVPDLVGHAEELIASLIERAGGRKQAAPAVLFRKTDHRRVNAKADEYALAAWQLQVMAVVNASPVAPDYKGGTVTPDFLRQAVRFSASETGPRQVRDFLAAHGLALQIVPHLPRTYLDGAALRMGDGRFAIGLTLRYDRIDNFWFCLLHELAHVGLHLDGGEDYAFLDDHSLRDAQGGEGYSKEEEADAWAEEALVPSEIWERGAVETGMDVLDVAHEAGVHPAIVARRVRHETGDYRRFSQLVGAGRIRSQFAEPGDLL